jgi:hypothetical protein
VPGKRDSRFIGTQFVDWEPDQTGGEIVAGTKPIAVVKRLLR